MINTYDISAAFSCKLQHHPAVLFTSSRTPVQGHFSEYLPSVVVELNRWNKYHYHNSQTLTPIVIVRELWYLSPSTQIQLKRRQNLNKLYCYRGVRKP